MRIRRASKSDAQKATQPSPAATPQPASPSPAGRPVPLGQLLINRGAITPAELAEAVDQQAESGKKIGELLVDLGTVDERDVLGALSDQFGIGLAQLKGQTLDSQVAGLLPETMVRSLRALPIAREPDGTVVIATSNLQACAPSERGEFEAKLRDAIGAPVILKVATENDIRWAISTIYHAFDQVSGQVDQYVATHGRREAATATNVAIEAAASDAPVVKIVDMILTQAMRDRASDIHIEPQGEQVRVRYRIDGALHEALTLPGSMAGALSSRIKIMAGMSIVERRRPQDGQIAMTIDGHSVDIRVSTTGVVFGEKVVLRVLDRTKAVLQLRDLGMGGTMLRSYRDMLASPYGMVLCAGPTGSGKTTTLYASLNEINEVYSNITTIEDPVEYVFPSVNQIQINEAAGITFASGLRAILRQDPDVILVGEIRDVETANIAVQSALTGHFVLSSVHATDAVSSLYRFIDMGIETFLLSASVLGVVGQRLVRRTCNDCREPYQPTPDELSYYERMGGEPKEEFSAGVGCTHCAHTGYAGRVGVYELLSMSPEMKELIVRASTTHSDIRELAIAQGTRTLGQEGIRLVERDRTTIAEIIRSIYTL